MRGSPIEGRREKRSIFAPLSPRFLETPWKKHMFQFVGASRAFTVSFTTLRGEHIVSSGKYDIRSTENKVVETAFDPANVRAFCSQ